MNSPTHFRALGRRACRNETPGRSLEKKKRIFVLFFSGEYQVWLHVLFFGFDGFGLMQKLALWPVSASSDLQPMTRRFTRGVKLAVQMQCWFLRLHSLYRKTCRFCFFNFWETGNEVTPTSSVQKGTSKPLPYSALNENMNHNFEIEGSGDQSSKYICIIHLYN